MSEEAAAPFNADWPICRSEEGCIGARVAPYGNCLAHLTQAKLDRALSLLGPGADIDVRGTPFTEQLLTELIDAVRDPDGGRARFGRADFGSARFDEARFDGVEFGGDAVFDAATFNRVVHFTGTTFAAQAGFRTAQFHGDARFSRARFEGDANFEGIELPGAMAWSMRALSSERDRIRRGIGKGAEFTGAAWFDGAVFSEAAAFRGITFGGHARFDGAVFKASARFGAATFAADAGFASARFLEDATFAGAEFLGEPRFTTAKVGGRADFRGAALPDGARLDPAVATDLDVSELRAGQGLMIQCVVWRNVEASNVHCPQGLSLQLDGTIRVNASTVHSPATLTLTFKDGLLRLADAIFDTPTTISAGTLSGPVPRLLSLERVDATNLTLIGLDLKACRFLDCYKRDQLRVDGPLSSQFARQPANKRWIRRPVLAEEHSWRARFDRHHKQWFPDECRHPGESDPSPTPAKRKSEAARLEAARIQAVYRDLRKGREDAKDEPGAAELYYGEMEMRRFAARPRRMERALLTAYWLISGYGMRASRAVTALLIVILLGTAGFATVGFASSNLVQYKPIGFTVPGQAATYQLVTVPGPRPGWEAAFYHSVDSATSLLRGTPPVPSTSIGRALEICLMLLSPILLTLAVLALRGRVKR